MTAEVPEGHPSAALLRSFVGALVRDHPARLAWVVCVQVVTALTQGIGLLLLVPMLEVAGVTGGGGGSGAKGAAPFLAPARSAFHALGLQLDLTTLLITYVVLVALAASLGAYQSIRLARYRLEFVDGQRGRLYRAIARAEWRHLLGLRQSDLLTALTVDVNWVSQGTLAALNLMVSALLITVQVIVALRISPVTTLLALGTGGILTGLVWPLVVRSRRLGRELLANNRGVLASVTGFFDGLKLAKAHGLEDGHLNSFERAMRSSRRSQIAFAKASAAANAVQLSVTALVLAVLVEVAVVHLHMSLAELLVLAFIFTRLVPQLTSAQSSVQNLAQALPAFEELAHVIADCEGAAEDTALAPQVSTGPSPLRPLRLPLADAIRLEAVSFSYGTGSGPETEVLHDITLTMPARRTTALAGPSGSGKTTLADLVLGLLVPTSGSITVDGAALSGDHLARWRESIAMVPQEAFLFHDTLRANLLWACPAAGDADLWEALEQASAKNFVQRLPYGLDTVVGDRGGRLSGGERQRIALARALLRRPHLLVLDEATNSLDAANEDVILQALGLLHGEMTILLISHEPATIRHADQIVTLEHGHIASLRHEAVRPHPMSRGRPR